MDGTFRSTCCGKSRHLFDLRQLRSERFYLRRVEHGIQENVSPRVSFSLEDADLLFFLMFCADNENFCSFIFSQLQHLKAKNTMKLSNSKKIENTVNSL